MLCTHTERIASPRLEQQQSPLNSKKSPCQQAVCKSLEQNGQPEAKRRREGRTHTTAFSVLVTSGALIVMSLWTEIATYCDVRSSTPGLLLAPATGAVGCRGVQALGLADTRARGFTWLLQKGALKARLCCSHSSHLCPENVCCPGGGLQGPAQPDKPARSAFHICPSNLAPRLYDCSPERSRRANLVRALTSQPARKRVLLPVHRFKLNKKDGQSTVRLALEKLAFTGTRSAECSALNMNCVERGWGRSHHPCWRAASASPDVPRTLTDSGHALASMPRSGSVWRIQSAHRPVPRAREARAKLPKGGTVRTRRPSAQEVNELPLLGVEKCALNTGTVWLGFTQSKHTRGYAGSPTAERSVTFRAGALSHAREGQGSFTLAVPADKATLYSVASTDAQQHWALSGHGTGLGVPTLTLLIVLSQRSSRVLAEECCELPALVSSDMCLSDRLQSCRPGQLRDAASQRRVLLGHPHTVPSSHSLRPHQVTRTRDPVVSGPSLQSCSSKCVQAAVDVCRSGEHQQLELKLQTRQMQSEHTLLFVICFDQRNFSPTAENEGAFSNVPEQREEDELGRLLAVCTARAASMDRSRNSIRSLDLGIAASNDGFTSPRYFRVHGSHDAWDVGSSHRRCILKSCVDPCAPQQGGLLHPRPKSQHDCAGEVTPPGHDLLVSRGTHGQPWIRSSRRGLKDAVAHSWACLQIPRLSSRSVPKRARVERKLARSDGVTGTVLAFLRKLGHVPRQFLTAFSQGPT
ncbi:hypothetical protein TREES_T100003906 [Tupaia chinensis]|uniref:Uncharacterized protein n=1 Tax=Tupaia chinensis TaxID=246437 RepID=L9KZ83_TUPCH|nr:hypothetical protein TREES_T100003906 [Tupaia chinensis]